jgi:hypothetical protein
LDGSLPAQAHALFVRSFAYRKQLDVCTIEAIELSSLFAGSAILRGGGLEIPMGSSAHCGYWNLSTLPQLELKLASNIFKCVLTGS